EDEIRLSLMGLAALFSYLGLWRSFSPIDFVAIGATLVGGYPVFVETFHSLRHRSINMEVSMTVAIVASLLVGQFTAAVVETVFGQIIKLEEEAESRKAPIQRISDKLAAWLVEFTIVFAIITFIVTRNLISTISVIVVAGACGVAAGTPLAIVAVMGGLAKR